MKSFPPSLSAEEEQYYLQKYLEGDLEAKHILIERNLRLVAHVIKKYQHLEENPEDYPEGTSLQKKMKASLLAGKWFGMGRGIRMIQ